MKNVLSANYRLNRPQIFPGKGDKYLPEIIKELAAMLRKIQSSLKYEVSRLPNAKIRVLAHVLVEFAEDLHNDIGIWRAVEEYNLEFFNTPLPLVINPGEKPDEESDRSLLIRLRIQYLLWIQYHLLEPELIFRPDHEDFIFLAEKIAPFLDNRFNEIPQDSGVKAFLEAPNDYQWDIKRKLIWLGKSSYLFRNCYQDYVEKEGGKPEMNIIDDFICQETTCWSGLGVIDILASMSDIGNEQKNDIRSWYNRHMAYYKVVKKSGPVIELLNIINEKIYNVNVGEQYKLFDENILYFGSLVPYSGKWYWSGQQNCFDINQKGIVETVKKDFLSSSKTIVYRYCDDLAEKARETLKKSFDDFVKYHGSNMVIYPDGHAMAEDMQKQFQLHNESRLKKIEEESVTKKEIKPPDVKQNLPPAVLECTNGICVYFNPDEGQEVMRECYDLFKALKKKGKNLSQYERHVVRDFIYSDAVSPNFVKEVIKKYGDESVASAFVLRDDTKKYYLDYLMRRYKGHYFRKRYPHIFFVQ